MELSITRADFMKLTLRWENLALGFEKLALGALALMVAGALDVWHLWVLQVLEVKRADDELNYVLIACRLFLIVAIACWSLGRYQSSGVPGPRGGKTSGTYGVLVALVGACFSCFIALLMVGPIVAGAGEDGENILLVGGIGAVLCWLGLMILELIAIGQQFSISRRIESNQVGLCTRIYLGFLIVAMLQTVCELVVLVFAADQLNLRANRWPPSQTLKDETMLTLIVLAWLLVAKFGFCWVAFNCFRFIQREVNNYADGLLFEDDVPDEVVETELVTEEPVSSPDPTETNRYGSTADDDDETAQQIRKLLE